MFAYHQIKVASPYPIQHLSDLSIDWKPGEHGRVIIKGTSDEAHQINAALQASSDDHVHVYTQDGEREVTLFKGIVNKVEVTHSHGVHTVGIEGVSGSFQLDVQKRKRSFPEEKQTYSQLIGKLIQGYEQSDVLYHTGGKTVVGEAILQYEETDWALVKRLASRLHTIVVCDILESAKAKLHFGLPTGVMRSVDEGTPYQASKNLQAYQQAGGSSVGLHDTDFFTYEIETGELFVLGDSVRFRNKDMIVSEMSARMDKGQLVFRYKLSRPDGIRSEPILNPQTIGISLEGDVLDVRGEEVKLRLAIDKDDGVSDPHWYPFAPPTGSAMYCMPQVGTKASLYVPDASGSRAMILGSVRTNGGSSAKTGDANNRYFGTEHGSELKLGPDVVHIMGDPGGALQLSLNDASGIKIKSPKKLTIHADLELSLYTPKQIVFQCNSQLMAYQTGGSTGISVESEYHLLGEIVKAEGRDRTAYPPFDDEPKEGKPPEPPACPEPDPFDWGKLLTNVAIGLAVVVVVAAVAVLTVATLGTATMVAVGVTAAVLGTTGVVGQAISDYASGEVSDVMNYATTAVRETAIGAVSGALFGPVVAGTVLGRMAVGGGVGIFEDSASQLLQGKEFSWKEMATVGAIAFVTAGVLDPEVLGAGSELLTAGGKKGAEWISAGLKSAQNGYSRAVSKLKSAGSEIAGAISRASSHINPKNYGLSDTGMGAKVVGKVGDEPLSSLGGNGGKRVGETVDPTPPNSSKPKENPPEAEGTGNTKLPNRKIDSLHEKTQNVRGDINREIEKIRNSDEYKNLSKTQRDKLDRKLRKLSSGNVAVADVSIPGIKKEFQAHSQIHSADSVGSNVGDFSYSKVDKSLKSYVDDEFPRFNDTEAKILEDIASQIKDPNVKGRIDLFTELDACQSCSNLIMEFRRKFPNIELNVYSKSMK